MLGQTLGNFRILEQMSEGGMGRVYLAQHTSMDRRAVVKVLRAHLVEDEGMVQRFLNEANATATIDHPGIVYVMDVGRLPGSGRPYILMEYLEGETLQERLQRERVLAPDIAASIVRQIADALAAAHDKGIIHRDLKPSNVFLVPDSAVDGSERVKILDFGIAKLLGEGKSSVITHSDMLMGTPLYMSPEQCDGARTVDHRADLYALGCILFELLCGRPPFVDEGSGMILAAHLMREPPAPRSLAPSMPRGLEAVILRLLAKQPDERYPGARELVAALDALDGLAIPVRTTSMRMAVALPPISELHESRGGPGSPTTLRSTTGERVRPAWSSDGREHRRRWPILLGMAMAIAGAALVLPWLGGGEVEERPAIQAPAGSAAPEPVAAAARVGQAAEARMPKPAAAASPPDTAARSATESAAESAVESAAEIMIEIASSPEHAMVLHQGAPVGRTPFEGTYPASSDDLVFVVEKKGYEPLTLEVPADRDYVERVTLERKRARTRKKASRRRARPRQPERSSDTLRPEEGGPVNPF